MISIVKQAEINNTFAKMQDSQMRLVALLASERMWMSFRGNLKLENANKLCENVRLCLDLIWDRIVQGAATKEQQRRYKDALAYINSTANE